MHIGSQSLHLCQHGPVLRAGRTRAVHAVPQVALHCLPGPPHTMLSWKVRSRVSFT